LASDRATTSAILQDGLPGDDPLFCNGSRSPGKPIEQHFEGKYSQALTHVEAAEKLFPGVWDVQRLRFLLKDLEEFRNEITPVRRP
jgi:hypothetical protein